MDLVKFTDLEFAHTEEQRNSSKVHSVWKQKVAVKQTTNGGLHPIGQIDD